MKFYRIVKQVSLVAGAVVAVGSAGNLLFHWVEFLARLF